MKFKTAKKFVELELKDLDVQPNSKAWNVILPWAIEWAEIQTKQELVKSIEEYLEQFSFLERGHKE